MKGTDLPDPDRPEAERESVARGTCPGCGDKVWLDQDYLVRPHTIETGGYCPGSNLTSGVKP